jgi:hypothetical protein
LKDNSGAAGAWGVKGERLTISELQEHGGVRGEARFPPLDGPQKLPAQFIANLLPNHVM